MLNVIMTGGGKNNEDFKYSMHSLEKKLNKKVLKIHHIPYHEADAVMAQAEATAETAARQ